MATSSVSKVLHMLCQDPHLWKHLMLRDFGRGNGTVLCVHSCHRAAYLFAFYTVALKLKGGSSWKQVFFNIFPPATSTYVWSVVLL